MNKYTPQQIKDCGVFHGPRWIPYRPYTPWKFVTRLRLAWGVFVGRYDALDWEEI